MSAQPRRKSRRQGRTFAGDGAALSKLLTAWYARVARDLPWRRTRDPYAIWISEVMLQQTRVETVLPYYRRFLGRFSTVSDLAAADLEEVLRLWSGLGYYRRARQLHAAARDVEAHHGGRLPSEAALLLQLPGIGRYTAGAIASIAFDRCEPVVDGNVLRVLARLLGLDDDMDGSAGKRRVWQAASELVPVREPGQFNQALMELGATVCVPRAPACGSCPLRRRCVAARAGAQAELPRLRRKRPAKTVHLVAAVVEHADSGLLLLAHRQPDGLFGGLWEPPMVPARALDAARQHLGTRGVPASAQLAVAGRLQHALTHRRLHVLVAVAAAGRRWRLPREADATYTELRWRRPSEVPLSTLARKVLDKAGAAQPPEVRP